MMLVGGLLHAAPDGAQTVQPAQAPGDAGALSRTNSIPASAAGAAETGAEPSLRPEGSNASTSQAAFGEGDAGDGKLSARVGTAPGGIYLAEHLQALGCLRVAVSQGLLSREDLKQVGAVAVVTVVVCARAFVCVWRVS